MTHFICTTCGTQFAVSQQPPEQCPICLDERQYVGWEGQSWTTLEQLRAIHQADIRLEEPGLHGIGADPGFAIAQRALLIQHPQGNVLWDCTSLLNQEMLEYVTKLGGVRHIAISHPHYYSSMIEWAEAFDATIHLHRLDQQWVMRPDPRIHFWQGESLELLPEIKLLNCGGHFEGATVLHWANGAEGRGALLTGDILTVASDRRWVSFMYSYPNLIPLNASAIRRIVGAVEPLAFERIYGAWWGRVVQSEAKQAVLRSAERYIRAISEVDV